MACRGVCFSISEADAARLRDAPGDDEVMAIVDEIEERWDKDHLCEVDKAWDAIHRALTVDERDASTLAKVVLGGRQLHEGDEYVVSHLSPSEVSVVQSAIGRLNSSDFADRYFRIDAEDYGMALTKDDAYYAVTNFQDMQNFFFAAARSGRAVIFTVDR